MAVTAHPLEQALDLSTHKFVQASAGAGKTFALSKRYCAILDEFTRQNLAEQDPSDWLGVRNILVITFTRKAAEEMATRIYQDLHTLLQGEEITALAEQGITLGTHLRTAPAEYKRWLQSTFAQNAISTIDSLCGRIIRDHAKKVDLDPEFRMEDEVLASRHFQETLDQFLQTKGQEFDADLQVLLEATSIHHTREFLAYLYDNRLFLRPWIHRMAHSTAEDIRTYWIDEYTPACDVDRILQEVRQISQYSTCSVNDPEDKGILWLQEIQDRIQSAPSDVPDNELRRWVITELLPLFTTGSGTYMKRIPGSRAKWSNPDENIAYKNKTKALLEWLGDELPHTDLTKPPSNADFEMIPVLQSLVKLYQAFERTIQDRQSALNYLTFSDVIEYTLRLLREYPAVRREYAEQYQHILVDEFQDTNNPRWEIIRMLANPQDEPFPDRGLFVVGDKKQSIFRFQYADVTIMNRTQAELSGKSSSPEGVRVLLNENFRSSDEYINTVINPLFSTVLPESGEPTLAPYEAGFSPTRCNPNGVADAEIAQATSPCAVVRAVTNRAASDQYVPAYHAALTAREMLAWAETVGLDEQDGPTVAILLRQFTRIQEYQKVFQSMHLPFEIVSGRGLFQQQEAYDLLHWLSVLRNPCDDLAMTGLLRSPIFGISDAVLDLVRHRSSSTQSVYDVMQDHTEFSGVLEEINQWQRLAAVHPVDQIFESIIESGVRPLGYLSEIGGKQRLANINKLLNLLRQQGMEGHSLEELYSTFSYLVDQDTKESQNDLLSSAQIVFMTVHGAKGLEFPAVILPELARQAPSDRSRISHAEIDADRIEVGMSLSDDYGESRKTNLLSRIKAQEKLETTAEDRRLFYVAVTRAQYRIAFLGEFDEIKPSYAQNWWNAYVAEHYQLPQDEDPEVWTACNAQWPDTAISLLTADALKEQLETPPLESVQWQDLPTYPDNRRYLRTSPHRLIWPDGFTGEAEGGGNSAADNSGRAFGQLFHTVMEHQWIPVDDHTDSITTYLETELPEAPTASLLEELHKQVQTWTEHPVAEQIGTCSPGQVFREHRVTGWLESPDALLEVNGIIDLLYCYEGEWRILDYKTDMDTTALLEYRQQIQTYQWMVQQLYGISARGQIYFSALGELVEVEWEPDYFQTILPDQQPVNPAPIQETDLAPGIREALNQSTLPQITIITPTRRDGTILHKALAAAGDLHPQIQVVTTGMLLQDQVISGKRLTLPLMKLLIGRLYEEEYDTQPSPGQINQLADALLTQEEYPTEMDNDYRGLEQRFLTEKADQGWMSRADIIDYFLKTTDLQEQSVIVHGFYQLAETDFRLMQGVAEMAGEFFFVDNFNGDTVQTAFPYTPEIWSRQFVGDPLESDRFCEHCFSREEEVDRLARHILAIDQWEEKTDDILVAVSSMDEYRPILRRVFARYKLPVRMLSDPMLSTTPVATLVIHLLDLMSRPQRLTWEDVASVWLHPMMQPGAALFRLDRWVQTHRPRRFQEIGDVLHEAKEAEIENFQKQNLGRLLHTYQALRDQVKTWVVSQPHLFALAKHMQAFLKTQILRDSDSVADQLRIQADAVNRVIGDIPLSFQAAGVRGGIPEFKAALSDRLEATTDRSGLQEDGIEIAGFLDTVNARPGYLFVLGMNETHFPVSPPHNPYLTRPPYNPWPMNMMEMQRWNSLPGEVRYFCAARSTDGTPLQPSSFTEYLQNIPWANRPSLTPDRTARRTIFLHYLGKQITDGPDLPVIQRHNQYIHPVDPEALVAEYRGKVPGDETGAPLTLSASSMDNLLKCPMRFWFGNLMQIEPMTYDPQSEFYKNRGLMVHETFELFGKEGGFTLASTDWNAAVELMKTCCDQALVNNHISTDESLLVQEQFRQFIEHFEPDSDLNLFLKALRWHRERLQEFTEIGFEQAFGMPEYYFPDSAPGVTLTNGQVTMTCRGVIDKIMQHRDGTAILATDYKTGNISLADVLDGWSSQLFVYFLALKQLYPDFRIIMAYEQVKSLRDDQHGISPLAGEIDMEQDPVTGKGKDVVFSKEGEDGVNPGRRTKAYLELGEKVQQGMFHLATAELDGKACEYCDFERICRKHSVYR